MINEKAFKSGIAIVGGIVDEVVVGGASQMSYETLTKLNKAVYQIMVATGLTETVVTATIMRSIKEARANGPKGYAKRDYFIAEMQYELIAATNLAAMSKGA
jgi:hypothetical protein